MELVMGGCYQGKLETVLKRMKEDYVLVDGAAATEEIFSGIKPEQWVIWNHLHQWIYQCLEKGQNPEEKIGNLLKERRNCIIICDEIGNGVVPVDALEREYRECTGRILIRLAAGADKVVRVICGIEQRIR